LALQLEFRDKYQLLAELVRGNKDRLFISTAERPRLGEPAAIELHLAGMRLVTNAQVVGLRRESKLFKVGVWVRFDDEEIERVRRLIGLNHSEVPKPGRRTRRLPCTLPVRLTRPALPNTAFARDLSETGCQLDTLAVVNAGQPVEVELELDDGTTVPLKAEVTRDNLDGRAVGLRFMDVSAGSKEKLRSQLDRLAMQPWPGKSSVLVADDEPGIVDFLKRMLSPYGYDVHKAKNGSDALALVRELKPKLVVLDILMPGVDGVDVCKTMRSDVELADIPVVFVSALALERLHEVADEAGATDYLPKPVALDDLLSVVGEYLQQTEH
jgi:CheY-like chemotaxis protein